MDSWFTNETFIKRLLDEGLDTIGMLKDNRQMYRYGRKLVNLMSGDTACGKLSTDA